MASPNKPRGRLFRKYVVLFVTLVTGVLLASGLLAAYIAYEDNKTSLVRIQREKALAAAIRIEGFIKEIERQMGWIAQAPWGARAATLDQQRVDSLRLLRQVPAITEISHLDPSGKEQLRVSRLAMDVVRSQVDFSREPKFLEAKSGKTYVSPVYFRKESEPYMTIAMAGSGGEAGVIVAEVNLKFIWDVISQIKIGKAGHAYVVDSRGHLIAHPDISLVLKKIDLSSLPQVQAARTGPPSPGPEPDEPRGVRRLFAPSPTPIGWDREGRQVLTAYAAIAPLGWFVFVQQPLEEAFAPLYADLVWAVTLLLVGIALSVVASLLLARRMVTPIRALQAGAARIGAGALDHRIAVQTGDELEALADQFNTMTTQLQESYTNLEQKVEARTRELSEALEQQTATSEILRVISSSPTDVHPVFRTILKNATQLCEANIAALFLYDGEVLTAAAHQNASPEFAEWLKHYRERPSRDRATPRAALERKPVHIHDYWADPEFVPTPAHEKEGARTVLAVPMLRENTLVGVITVWRREVRPFSDKQVALVRTFADQAVIAIENVRLFQELQARTRELGRSVEELTALGEVSQAVSSTLDIQTVLSTIVSRATQLSGMDAGAIYEYDETREVFELRATENLEEEIVAMLLATPIRRGEGATGRMAVARQPIQIPNIAEESYQSPVRDALLRTGYRALLAVPLLREDHLIGGLTVNRKAPGEFPPEVIELLQTFATQSALAIQNARLFREIEDKSRQLEIANRHKSEFLANMSHELRTPLNAIIGFSEVLLERMFGELNDKQAEYLQDIFASGRHLLSLINDILDLSKIEAGRMELELTSFDLPSALQNAITLVRERAMRHGITLDLSVDEHLGPFVADERKLKQILLNLLSNAVKFTAEGGRIGLKALLADGSVEISVSDTGIGIAPEDQEAIFEEFRQVGSDYARKREGTGLGLTLTRKFVELHGGRIWVKSAVGQGSTFTFTLPERPWPTS